MTSQEFKSNFISIRLLSTITWTPVQKGDIIPKCFVRSTFGLATQYHSAWNRSGFPHPSNVIPCFPHLQTRSCFPIGRPPSHTHNNVQQSSTGRSGLEEAHLDRHSRTRTWRQVNRHPPPSSRPKHNANTIAAAQDGKDPTLATTTTIQPTHTLTPNLQVLPRRAMALAEQVPRNEIHLPQRP